MTIRVLSPQEAAKIAAGEVIERPASIVKELVENSIDAGASRITIEIVDGGLALIRVIDDGCGIPSDEMSIAFQRHATSKIASEDDLTRIRTLGFRGEALASIAACARVEMLSRTGDQPSGVLLQFEGGVPVPAKPAPAPPGTTVTVRSLFERQPARLKFLRGPSTETSRIAEVVTRYALAYPDIRFALHADGRTSLQTPGDGNLRETVAAVYGPGVAASLIDLSTGSPPLQVNGLLGPQSLHRNGRNHVTLFVNRRWVRHRGLTFAIEEAYSGLLPIGRHPLAIVSLRLPEEEVDVNVHPAKTEIRLREERAIFAFVQRSVRRALTGAAPVPVWLSGPPAETLPSQQHDPSPAARPAAGATGSQTIDIPRQQTLPAALPVLRPLGQVGNTFLVAEGPEGLYLIDQHAAHERILFEQILSRPDAATASAQGLLQPLPIELPAELVHVWRTAEQELRQQGLELEPFGDKSLLLRSLPACLPAADPARAVIDLLDTLSREDPRGGDQRRRVAASLACHGSIRAGQPLSDDEMRELLRLLEATESPRTCPHGRPTMIHLSAQALMRQFERK